MSPSAGRRARVHGRPGGPPAGGVAPRAPPWVFTHHKATASGFHPFSKEALPRVFTPRQASPAPVPGSGQRPRKAPSRRPHRGGFLPWPSRRPHRAVGSSLPRLSPERAPAFYAASRRLSPTHSSLSSPRYVRQTPKRLMGTPHGGFGGPLHIALLHTLESRGEPVAITFAAAEGVLPNAALAQLPVPRHARHMGLLHLAALLSWRLASPASSSMLLSSGPSLVTWGR